MPLKSASLTIADTDARNRRADDLSVRPRVRAVLFGLCAFVRVAGSAQAADSVLADGFEGARCTWETACDDSQVRVLGHARSHALRHSGETAELVEVQGRAPQGEFELHHALPPATLIDDLALSLWLHSNQEGAALMVRAVLPQHIDLETGQPLTVLLDSAPYETPGQWQKLTCRDLKVKLQRALPRLQKSQHSRTGQRQQIETRGAYVDRAVVQVRMGRGVARFALDDLRFGPIVDASADAVVRQASGTEPRRKPEARVELDRLLVHGRPSFPRIIPHHGERPETLSALRASVVWVPDYQDTALLDQLAAVGLRATAAPPRAETPEGAPAEGSMVTLAPFGRETAPILFWNLGSGIAPQAKRALALWEEQIRFADQELKRPLMGDVAGLERIYSRRLSILGASRPALHTSFGAKPYRDWLIERRMKAQPGTFMMTWVHVEPPPEVARPREAAGRAAILAEPESLRLQVYSALAAGYRGLGYWTYTSLDEDERPGSVERRLTLAQLNQEIELLEPWLATGSLVGQTPVLLQAPPGRDPKKLDALGGPATSPHTRRELEAQVNDRRNQLNRRERLGRDPEAAILRTDEGLLVLPIWYGEDAAFVPEQMTANNARIVVPGVGESARAFEVSTTAVTALDSKRVTGGEQITLPKFDVTAAIVVVEDTGLIERLRARVNVIAESSARIWLELGRARLTRITEVERRIREFGRGQPDAARILTRASGLLDRAEADWQAQRYHDSRLRSADAMQLLRLLTHVYWSDAVRRLYSPVSSPHTLCFQTLPDHWDMVARHGRARHAGGVNLLRSGDFEDRDTMVAEGWTHEQTAVPGVRSDAELYPQPHQGTYCLRLIAAPATGEDPPPVISDRPVTVTSPPVTVSKGQLVHMTGWVKVAAPSLGNLDGALFYDSLGGPASALRWRTPADWQKFDLLREATETGEMTVTMALSGLGEIRFDDLQIIPLETDAGSEGAEEKSPAGARPDKPKALDFLKRLPGFGGKAAE